MIRVRHDVAATCFLVAFSAGSVGAQGNTTATDSAAVADSVTTRQYEVLVRLAHERLERALLIDSGDEARRKPLFLQVERYGRAAAQLMPQQPEGWFLVAAAMGLRAEYESTRTQIRLGGEIWAMAATALDRDSTHAGAHHVMGRLNLEAMSLSAIERLIATAFYGSDLLRRASWDQAERHLRRAAALEPAQLYHILWLARYHIERDDEAAARALLTRILAADPLVPLDTVWKEEAAEELERL